MKALQMAAFWDRTVPEPNTGCLLWVGAYNHDGYGTFGYTSARKTKRFAHRVAYELSNGLAVPDGLRVLHRCDTPAYVNPAHLLLGTQTENVADATRKGRMRGGNYPKQVMSL